MDNPQTARDIMVTKLVTLRPDQDVYEAIDMLLRHKVAGAPVVDDEGRLVGFLSEKDCMNVLMEGAMECSPTARVGCSMSTEVKTISEDTDLLEVAHLFLSTSYRRLPVVRDGRLVGQISRRDFLTGMSRWMAPDKPNEHRPTFLYVSAVTDRANAPVS